MKQIGKTVNKNKETSVIIKMKNGDAYVRNAECMDILILNGVLTLRDGINIDNLNIDDIEEVKIV